MSASGFKAYRRAYGLFIGGAMHIAMLYNGMHAIDSYLDHREDAAIVQKASETPHTPSKRGAPSLDDYMEREESSSDAPRLPMENAQHHGAYAAGFFLGAELYRILKCVKRTHGGRIRDAGTVLDPRIK